VLVDRRRLDAALERGLAPRRHAGLDARDAEDLELDAAVLLVGLVGVALGDRAVRAVPLRVDAVRVDAELHERPGHRVGALLRERRVLLRVAPLVAVARELDVLDLRVLVDDRRDLFQELV
jgi:hypothetical protein